MSNKFKNNSETSILNYEIMLYQTILPLARKTGFKNQFESIGSIIQKSQDLRGRSIKEGVLLRLAEYSFMKSSSQSIC